MESNCNKIYQEIDNVNTSFFIENNIETEQNRSLVHLISWDKIYKPKYEGDPRIKKLEDINAAILANLVKKIYLTRIA